MITDYSTGVHDALNILFDARERCLKDTGFFYNLFLRWLKPCAILRRAQHHIAKEIGYDDIYE